MCVVNAPKYVSQELTQLFLLLPVDLAKAFDEILSVFLLAALMLDWWLMTLSRDGWRRMSEVFGRTGSCGGGERSLEPLRNAASMLSMRRPSISLRRLSTSPC